MTYIVDHPGQRPEDRRAYDTADEADRAVKRLHARNISAAVAWFCSGVEVSVDAPETIVIAPVSDLSGGVGSKVIRKILGRNGTVQEEEAS